MNADWETGYPRGTEKVLLVDDEPSVRKLSRRLLSSLGYTVVAVPTPEAAIGHFAADPDDFELVITDMSTLEISDGELHLVISTMRPGIPILLHTGGIVSGYGGGVIRGVLQKPSSLKDFARVVRGILDAPKSSLSDPIAQLNASGICRLQGPGPDIRRRTQVAI